MEQQQRNKAAKRSGFRQLTGLDTRAINIRTARVIDRSVLSKLMYIDGKLVPQPVHHLLPFPWGEVKDASGADAIIKVFAIREGEQFGNGANLAEQIIAPLLI